MIDLLLRISVHVLVCRLVYLANPYLGWALTVYVLYGAYLAVRAAANQAAQIAALQKRLLSQQESEQKKKLDELSGRN